MTSDYYFRGMISPEGHIRREAYEGLSLLRRVIRAYADAMAKLDGPGVGARGVRPRHRSGASGISRVRRQDRGGVSVTGNGRARSKRRVDGADRGSPGPAPRSVSGPKAGGSHLERQLRLAGGGHLLFLANVGDEAESVSLKLSQARHR